MVGKTGHKNLGGDFSGSGRNNMGSNDHLPQDNPDAGNPAVRETRHDIEERVAVKEAAAEAKVNSPPSDGPTVHDAPKGGFFGNGDNDDNGVRMGTRPYVGM